MVALDMMYPDMYNYNLAMLSQQTDRREKQETMKMTVVSQTTDQVMDMMHNLSEDLDWDTVRSRGHY